MTNVQLTAKVEQLEGTIEYNNIQYIALLESVSNRLKYVDQYIQGEGETEDLKDHRKDLSYIKETLERILR